MLYCIYCKEDGLEIIDSKTLIKSKISYEKLADIYRRGDVVHCLSCELWCGREQINLLDSACIQRFSGFTYDFGILNHASEIMDMLLSERLKEHGVKLKEDTINLLEGGNIPIRVWQEFIDFTTVQDDIILKSDNMFTTKVWYKGLEDMFLTRTVTCVYRDGNEIMVGVPKGFGDVQYRTLDSILSGVGRYCSRSEFMRSVIFE